MPMDAAHTDQGNHYQGGPGRAFGIVRDFYTERVVRGRREYECQFCRGSIAKASLHVLVSSCSCGQFASHRAHIECQESATGRAVEIPTKEAVA